MTYEEQQAFGALAGWERCGYCNRYFEGSTVDRYVKPWCGKGSNDLVITHDSNVCEDMTDETWEKTKAHDYLSSV
jgi:hypothetical protein